jgi:hypothetical protein
MTNSLPYIASFAIEGAKLEAVEAATTVEELAAI